MRLSALQFPFISEILAPGWIRTRVKVRNRKDLGPFKNLLKGIRAIDLANVASQLYKGLSCV